MKTLFPMSRENNERKSEARKSGRRTEKKRMK